MMWDRLTIGGWVSTDAGCLVRYIAGEDRGYATLILGSADREFEIALDRATLGEVVEQGAKALRALEPQPARYSGPPSNTEQ